jgi:arsenate reductase (glutaredoxin)
VLTVYEKPTCSTCRNLVKLLGEQGVEFERVDFHEHPLPEERIRELVQKTGLPARELFRRHEPIFSELGLGEREVDDEEAIRLMAEYPALLQRPVVERGDRAVLARPVDRALELLP